MSHDPVRTLLIPLAVLVGGCWGRGFPYEGGEPQDTSAPPASVCGEDLDLTAGINITGTAYDLETGLPLALPASGTALCVSVIDPAPAVVGGDPETLIVSTLCDDGTFVLAGLGEPPAIGAMIGVYDCNDEGTVQRTVTGVAPEEFEGLDAGDTLEGVTAYSVSASYLATIQTDLAYAGDLGAAGFLAGFVEDAAALPLGGATVTCASCSDTPTYYRDGDATDGLWGQGGVFNTATDTAGGGLFLVPAARITTYTCDDGGVHSFEGNLFGSLPDYAVFIRFTAL